LITLGLAAVVDRLLAGGSGTPALIGQMGWDKCIKQFLKRNASLWDVAEQTARAVNA
jgi:hypothetical protein